MKWTGGAGHDVGDATEPVWVFAGETSRCQARFGLGQMKHHWIGRVGVAVWGHLALSRGRERSRVWVAIHAVLSCPQVLAEKRSLGSRDGPPHLVVVVLLHSRAAAHDSLRLLQSQDSAIVRADEGTAGGFVLLCPRLKQRWRFVTAQAGEEAPLLVRFLVLVPLAAPLMEVFWVQGIFTLS